MSIYSTVKSWVTPQETKSTTSSAFSSFINFLNDSGHSDLGDFVSIDLYSKVAPLATAVNLVSDGVAGLAPIVVDKDGESVDHPVLQLLANPNADQTKTEFMKRFAAFMVITGDNYTMANGNVNAPPLEISIPSPQTANFTLNNIGDVGQISINKTGFAFDFVKDPKSRYFDGPLRELWHSKTFNPFPDAIRGQSPLTPIFFDIEQYKQSSQHNLSILKRGARPSGVFLSKTALTDGQYTRLKEQVDQFFAGSTNAGRPMLADGEGIDFKEMMLSPRDMDFLKLKENVTIAIYNQLKIPLPLVTPDQQTMANMAAANMQLYDNAVMPLADRIFEELTLFLMPRYKGAEGLRITYDKAKIEALELRKASILDSRAKLGIYTIDELRAIDNLDPIEGGQELSNAPKKEPETSKSKFFSIMKKNSPLSDEELTVIANKHGLN